MCKAYQAVVDTVAAEWTTVRLPWAAFVPVARARHAPELGPLEPADITSFRLFYSRFEFDDAPNANFSAGARTRMARRASCNPWRHAPAVIKT